MGLVGGFSGQWGWSNWGVGKVLREPWGGAIGVEPLGWEGR